MKNDKKLFVGAGLLIAVAIIANGVFVYGTADETTITVLKVERVSYGSGDSISHKYLVYAEGETFENSDSLLWGKFDSSDIHGKLQTGKEYRAKVYGWRLPFLSSYRNIISVREIKDFRYNPDGTERKGYIGGYPQ